MKKVILINEADAVDYEDLARAEMTHWWGDRCKHHRIGQELLVEVGGQFALREGVKRLKSFGIGAKVVRRDLPY